jgi:ANTAR domain
MTCNPGRRELLSWGIVRPPVSAVVRDLRVECGPDVAPLRAPKGRAGENERGSGVAAMVTSSTGGEARCVCRSKSWVARSAPWTCSPPPPRAWDDSEVAAAHAYAGVVASLLGSAVAAHASSRLANQLQTALDSRVLIEQAKGVLMASEKVDAQTAFTRLRRQARNTSRPLPEVAQEIIDGVWGSPTYRRPAKPGLGNEVAQKR